MRIRDLEPGQSFVTILTNRIGTRVSDEPPSGGAVGVEVTLSKGMDDLEEKTLHDNVLVLPWPGWVN